MAFKYQHGFNEQRDKLSRNNYVGASLPLFMAIKPILSEMAMICGMVLLCVVCPPSPLTRQRCSVAAWHLRDRQHPVWSGRAKLGNLSLSGSLQCHPVDAQPSHTQHDEQSGEHHTLTCPHIVTRTIAGCTAGQRSSQLPGGPPGRRTRRGELRRGPLQDPRHGPQVAGGLPGRRRVLHRVRLLPAPGRVARRRLQRL